MDFLGCSNGGGGVHRLATLCICFICIKGTRNLLYAPKYAPKYGPNTNHPAISFGRCLLRFALLGSLNSVGMFQKPIGALVQEVEQVDDETLFDAVFVDRVVLIVKSVTISKSRRLRFFLELCVPL